MLGARPGRRAGLADDRDILAVFERRFTDLTDHLDQRFGQIDQRFEQIDQRFEQIDQRFEQIDQRFGQIDQRFEGLETEVRHVQVQVESLRDADRQLADGIAAVDQKLDRFRIEVDGRFTETQSMIRLSHSQIEDRIKNLEGRYDELDARLTALETGHH
jgi:chromosome segregation ATPase